MFIPKSMILHPFEEVGVPKPRDLFAQVGLSRPAEVNTDEADEPFAVEYLSKTEAFAAGEKAVRRAVSKQKAQQKAQQQPQQQQPQQQPQQQQPQQQQQQ